MSFERMFHRAFFYSIACVAGLLSFTAGPAAAYTERDSAICDRAVIVDAGTTSRLPDAFPGDELFLRVAVPGPGFLSLDAVASAASDADPVLILASTNCGGLSPSRPVTLERTLGSVLLGVESAGEIVFRLTSSDPSIVLSDVKVHTGHSAFEEDEEEIETEPNPFAEPFKPSPFEEDEEEIETEPNPFADPGSKKGSRVELCSLGTRDDHGDTPRCATALTMGVSVGGEIANDWGDDVDVFRFDLKGSDLRRVELSTSGQVATAVLFDRHGARLGRFQPGADLRMARILRPGVYFVRVEGRSGTEGAYRLKLDVSAP